MDEEETLAAYLAGEMSSDEREAFEATLCEDEAALKGLLDQRRISAALHALLGDSEVLIQSVLTTTRGRIDFIPDARKVTVFRPAQRRSPVVVIKPRRRGWGVAAIVALGAFGFWSWHRQQPLAKIVSSAGVEWTGRQWMPGEVVRHDTLSVAAGVVEVAFPGDARIAIEGPAVVSVEAPNRVRLVRGKLGAVVPPAAHGFTVETADGKVVDLGTSFGVSTDGTTGTETHVFEGRVDVSAGNWFKGRLEHGMALGIDPATATTRSLPSDPALFPRPARDLGELLIDGDFETGTARGKPSIPTTAGVWGGDPGAIVEEFRGVRPHSGRTMLRFLNSEQKGSHETSKTRFAERWQIVDLRPFKVNLAHGTAVLSASAEFNQVAAKPDPDDRFMLEVLAFRGDPAQAQELWLERKTAALAQGQNEVDPDTDPATWERGQVSLTLPPETDFLLVSVQAHGAWNPTTAREVGRFADSATVRLQAPPQASVGKPR